MGFHTWTLFFVSTIGLSLMPGPNGLLVLAHGARYGQRMALFTIAGGVLGFVLLLGLCMLGVGTLVQGSAEVLPALQWLGGAYLVWLGFQAWRAPAGGLDGREAPTAQHAWALFGQGWLTAVTNPKVLLFFAAFLPQFIDLDRALALQFAVMAASFAVVEFAVEAATAGVAGRLRGWMQVHGRRFNQGCGLVFIIIGAGLALGR